MQKVDAITRFKPLAIKCYSGFSYGVKGFLLKNYFSNNFGSLALICKAWSLGSKNLKPSVSNLFLALIFVLSAFGLTAGAQQIAPVLANTQVSPPYSSYLSDYASPGSTKLQVNLFLKDLTKTNYPCRLRIKIEGFGITIQSKNDFNVPALFLNGGELSVITGADLEPYLSPQNLVFQGLNQTEFARNGGKLPEGIYRFTVEVIDYYRKSLVSNSALSVVSIFLAYPPIINQPFNLSKVTPLDPQNVVFQWTPRSTGSINSAYSIAYKFRLAEIVPADRDPNDAIRTSRPLYETFTDQTVLVYGLTEPGLIPGNSYAVQVQAVEAEGKDLFVNNGNSEVVKFTYGDKCASPINIMAELSGPNSIKVSWNALPLQQAFTIRYRESDNPTAQWFEQEVFTPSYLIQGLRSSTAYEFQVKAQCIYGYGDYSELQTFNVPDEALTQGDFVCGKTEVLPAVEQGDLLPVLAKSMVFFAGKFPVVVTDATGSNGTFSGTGTVGVPFLNALSFKVEFRDIRISTALKMTSGKVSFLRGTLEESIDQAVAGITVKPDADGNVGAISKNGLPTIVDAAIIWPIDLPKYDAVARTVKFTASVDGGTPKEITIKLKEGQPPFVFQDRNNETFSVDKDGKVAHLGKIPPKELLAGGNSTSYALNTEKAGVEFLAPNQKYGLDAYQKNLGTNATYASAYQALTDNGKEKPKYYVARKSIESHQPDEVQARIKVTDRTLLADKVEFKTGSGEKLSSNFKDSIYTIHIIGALADNDREIYAYHPNAATGGAYIGKLNISAFNKISKKVVLVPVNGNGTSIDAASVQQALNKIYQQAVVEWEVKLADNFDGKNTAFDNLETANSNVMSAYTDGQKALVRAYKEGHKLENGTYYIFLVKGLSDGSAGYMVRGGQVGFVSLTPALSEGEGAIMRTIAHELGHGAFMLQHTWADPGLEKGSTKNLMDYAGGTELWYSQWRYMRNPDLIFRPFEGDDEGSGRFPDRELILKILKKIKETNSKKGYVFNNNMGMLDHADLEFSDYFDLGGKKKVELSFVTRKTADMFSTNYVASYYSAKVKRKNWEGLTIYEFSIANVSNILTNSYTKGDLVFEFQVPDEDKEVFEKYLEFDKDYSAFRSNDPKPKGYELKEEDLQEIFPNTPSDKVADVTKYINKYSDQFEINTPLRMAHFLGQIGAETGLTDLLENSYTKSGILSSNKTRTLRLKDGQYVLKYCDLFDGYNTESTNSCPFPNCDNVIVVPEKDRYKEGNIWYAKVSFMTANNSLSPKSKYYANSPNNLDFFNYVYACHTTLLNGNIDSGDGSRFRGRGFIQLTGYVNYKEFQRKWNLALAKDNPKNFICRTAECDSNLELLNTDTETGMLAAMAFWKGAGANAKSTDIEDETIKNVSKVVNGALHGITQRISYTKNAYKILSDEK